MLTNIIAPYSHLVKMNRTLDLFAAPCPTADRLTPSSLAAWCLRHSATFPSGRCPSAYRRTQACPLHLAIQDKRTLPDLEGK